MTTAQYRAMGYDAARNRDYAEAARLYQLALDNYPPHQSGGLAKRDKAQLQVAIANYTHAAKYVLQEVK